MILVSADAAGFAAGVLKTKKVLKTKMIFENNISEKTRALLKSIELNDLPQVLEDISILEKWSKDAVCIVDGRTPFYKGGMHLKNFDELCKKILNFKFSICFSKLAFFFRQKHSCLQYGLQEQK